MDAENLIELNTLHSELGKYIFTLDSLKLEKELRDEIKYSLLNATEIVLGVIEQIEDANTINENERIGEIHNV